MLAEELEPQGLNSHQDSFELEAAGSARLENAHLQGMDACAGYFKSAFAVVDATKRLARRD